MLRAGQGQGGFQVELGDGLKDGGMDEATQTHIRNLDVYVARLLEELSAGRDDLIQQVRSEIKLLARTIAASSKGD